MRCDYCGEPIEPDQPFREGTTLTVHESCQLALEARARQRMNEALERRLLD